MRKSKIPIEIENKDWWEWEKHYYHTELQKNTIRKLERNICYKTNNYFGNSINGHLVRRVIFDRELTNKDIKTLKDIYKNIYLWNFKLNELYAINRLMYNGIFKSILFGIIKYMSPKRWNKKRRK